MKNPMKKTGVIAALALAAGIALTGCTPSAPTPGSEGPVQKQDDTSASKVVSYDNIDDLLAAYTDNGGDCENPITQTEGVIEGNEVRICDDGATVAWIAEANVEEMQKGITETALKGFLSVVGENWIVFNAQDEALGEAMGGTVYK